MKSQFKRADASGAKFALIFGATEMAAGSVAVKPLRADPGGAVQAQALQSLDDVASWSVSLKA